MPGSKFRDSPFGPTADLLRQRGNIPLLGQLLLLRSILRSQVTDLSDPGALAGLVTSKFGIASRPETLGLGVIVGPCERCGQRS